MSWYDYSNLIQIDDKGVASRTVPDEMVYGLSPQDLSDLHWLDPNHPRYDYKWWPGVRVSQDLPRGMKYGAEIFTIDNENKQVFISYEIVPFTEEDIAQQKASQLYLLNYQFSQAMQALQTGWPIYEILTWDKQSTEANAWLKAPADDKPETPFLSSLVDKCVALGADDTLEDLISRVHANDARYTEAVTSIIAVRHVAEDQINTSDVPQEVTWQFPG